MATAYMRADGSLQASTNCHGKLNQSLGASIKGPGLSKRLAQRDV